MKKDPFEMQILREKVKKPSYENRMSKIFQMLENAS